jgi:hypothetical protein
MTLAETQRRAALRAEPRRAGGLKKSLLRQAEWRIVR